MSSFSSEHKRMKNVANQTTLNPITWWTQNHRHLKMCIFWWISILLVHFSALAVICSDPNDKTSKMLKDDMQSNQFSKWEIKSRPPFSLISFAFSLGYTSRHGKVSDRHFRFMPNLTVASWLSQILFQMAHACAETLQCSVWNKLSHFFMERSGEAYFNNEPEEGSYRHSSLFTRFTRESIMSVLLVSFWVVVMASSLI